MGQPRIIDNNREMITFYMSHRDKVLMMKAAKRTPAGNLSALLRDLCVKHLIEKGYLSEAGEVLDPKAAKRPPVAGRGTTASDIDDEED